MTGPNPSLGQAIDQAARLLASDPERAGQEAQALLRHAPKDPRLLLVLASSRRRLGDARGARQVLEPLARAYPNAANTAYELGLALADLGQAAAAI